MRKKNYKGRCQKRVLSKCKDVCKTYDDISYAYADLLQADDNIQAFQCHVPLHSLPDGEYIDNGPMEGYWGLLKSEMYYLQKFDSKDELSAAIENYIHFYNTKRYQLRLHSMTPMEFHAAFAA